MSQMLFTAGFLLLAAGLLFAAVLMLGRPAGDAVLFDVLLSLSVGAIGAMALALGVELS